MTAQERKYCRTLLKRYKHIQIRRRAPGFDDKIRIVNRKGRVVYAYAISPSRARQDCRVAMFEEGCTSRKTLNAALLAISRYDADIIDRQYKIWGLKL